MSNLNIYLTAVRAGFFPATAIPVILGTAVAWRVTGEFNFVIFLITLFAALAFHAGANLFNDYCDYSNDTGNTNPLTPFAGGSRVLQQGLMSLREVLTLSVVFFLAGSAAGLYLAVVSGAGLLLIGAVGLLLAIFYSAPPLSLASRGLGEITVGLEFGLITVAGAYFVQTGNLANFAEIIFASLPISFLVAALVYINEFPDYEADKSAGKRNLVVRLGKKRACGGFILITVAAYISIIIGIYCAYLPPLSLVALAGGYFSVAAARDLQKFYNDKTRLKPAIKQVIAAHAATGVLLILALVF